MTALLATEAEALLGTLLVFFWGELFGEFDHIDVHGVEVFGIIICPYLFLSLDLSFLSRNYSSLPHHQPADYTCLHNCFLPSNSLDFFDSFPLTHMCFFMIPSHSTVFHLFLHCSRTFRVSGI